MPKLTPHSATSRTPRGPAVRSLLAVLLLATLAAKSEAFEPGFVIDPSASLATNVQQSAGAAAAAIDLDDPAERQRWIDRGAAGVSALTTHLASLSVRERPYHQGVDLLRDVIHAANGDSRAEASMGSALALAHQKATDEHIRRLTIELMADSNATKLMRWLSYKIREPEYRRTAIRTLGRSRIGAATGLLMQGLANDKDAVEELYLRALGTRGDARAVPSIAPFLQSSRPLVARAAIEALGSIAVPESAQQLLPYADDAETPLGLAAMFAIDRVAKGLIDQEHREESADIYGAMLTRLKSSRAHGIALGGLYHVGRPADAKVILERLVDFEDQRLVPLFIEAAVNIGRRADHAVHGETLRPLYEQVRLLTPESHPFYAILAGRLRALGQGKDVTVTDGVLRQWWVHGGFVCPSPDQWDVPLAFESHVDVRDRTPHGPSRSEWITTGSYTPDGAIDLDVILRPNDRAIGYAYVELDIPEARDATLITGSDDALIVFLNGQRVFSHLQSRPHRIGDDRTSIQLTQGTNRLLLKLGDETDGWRFSARLVGSDDKPFPFVIKN